MNNVSVQFTEHKRKKAAAFVAMAAALDQFDPHGVSKAVPARDVSRERMVVRATSLAKLVKAGPNDATQAEFELARQFRQAIKRVQSGGGFTATDSHLADELAKTGMSIAGSCYTLAQSAS